MVATPPRFHEQGKPVAAAAIAVSPGYLDLSDECRRQFLGTFHGNHLGYHFKVQHYDLANWRSRIGEGIVGARLGLAHVVQRTASDRPREGPAYRDCRNHGGQ